MEGDLVANLPRADIFEHHLRTHADITAVCGDDSFATENGTYFEKEPDGRIREVLINMHRPRGYRSLDVFIMSTELLRSLVDECQARDQYSFRRDVLQAKQDLLNLQSYTFSGFAAQIRSVQEYYDRSMQLLDRDIRADLFTPERPVRAKGADKASTYIGPDGVCLNSLVAEGCSIEGTVVNSILFPGVTVEKGAEVQGCILFKGTAIRQGARASHIITDKNVELLPGRTMMGHATYPIVIAKGSVI